MILVDLNVLLDVLQKREPHYQTSAALLDHVLKHGTEAWIPAHAVTTIHYLVTRFAKRPEANQAIDWLLDRFRIAPVSSVELRRARTLAIDDYEDAVVAAAAEKNDCKAIITRNISDFVQSPIPAMTPQEYLITESG
jgi:predicted nucleic acid-binding protein